MYSEPHSSVNPKHKLSAYEGMSDAALKYLVAERSLALNAISQAEWAEKKYIWVPHTEHGFVEGQKIEELGDEINVLFADGSTACISADDVQKMNPPKFDKVEDMADLSVLNEASVLHNLRDRFQSDLIYTYSGLFCVVVNPYKRLPIYTERVIDMYKGKKRYEVPPHIFAITDNAYRSMLQDRENQTILCTGESGAGKTENTKKVIQYLASITSRGGTGYMNDLEKQNGGPVISPIKPTKPKSKAQLMKRKSSMSLNAKTGAQVSMGDLELQLLQANPILEAFGNAKTVKNDNSSRFGKFIKITFDVSGYISGANIETYLLEKARVIRQALNERTFHIFYQMLYGATKEMKEKFLLEDINEYPFISNGHESIAGQDDSQDFLDTLEALEIMLATPEEIEAILKCVSSCLLFGNVKVKQERNSDQAILTNNTVTQKICKLLGMPAVDFEKALLKPRIKVGREYVVKAQNQDQVHFSCESICKAIYERTFKWVAQKINKVLSRNQFQGASFVGILDIAGFEIFRINSFEQLCINYTNEKLQQLFNHTMFILEQEEYRTEGIEWKFIDFGLDLQPCIDLIEKPMGILALLDEECWFPKATDQTYVSKVENEMLGKAKFAKPDFRSQADFCVLHYAGYVEYKADKWLLKNMDPLNENLVQLLSESADFFVAALFKDTSSNPGFSSMANAGQTSRVRKGMFRTVSQLYKQQLENLMNVLHETRPHFVRCIIPNHEKKPGKMVAPLILEQLRCNGVLEGIRICRQGYPNRILFQEFRQRYEILTPNAIPPGFMDGRKAATAMLNQLDLDPRLYRIGKSKIFFRAGVLANLESERDEKLRVLIIGIQALARGKLAVENFKKLIQQHKAIQVLQRNGKCYLKLRNWQWWRLFTKVKPLLQVTSRDKEIHEREEELKKVQDQHNKDKQTMEEIEALLKKTMEERALLNEQIFREKEMAAEADDQRVRLATKKAELEEYIHDLEERIDSEEEKNMKIMSEKKRVEGTIAELEATLADEGNARQKLSIEKQQLENKLKAIEDSLANREDNIAKMTRDKAQMDARLKDTQSALIEEEDKGKALTKQKVKLETMLQELEDKLQKEEKAHEALDKQKRKLENTIHSLQDTLNDRENRVAELQHSLDKTMEDVARLTLKSEDDATMRSNIEKKMRELENKVSDLSEDLEAERAAHKRTDKLKRDLNEELQKINNELMTSVDNTAVLQDLRNKREQEAEGLKKELQKERDEHENMLKEMRNKYQGQVEDLEERMETQKKAAASYEKQKTEIGKERDLLLDELEQMKQIKADLDRKKRVLESTLNENTVKIEECEKGSALLAENNKKLTAELENLLQKQMDAESRVSTFERLNKDLNRQIVEMQENLENESRDKSTMMAKMRDLQASHNQTIESLEEEQDAREAIQNKLNQSLQQLADAKRAADEHANTLEEVENARRKLSRDQEDLNSQIDDLKNQIQKLEKSKKRLQGEVDDLQVDLEKEKTMVNSLQNQQKKFDATLNKERERADGLEADKDAYEKKCRDLESKVLSLQAELEDNNEKLLDSERIRKQQAAELSELMESKDDAGKNVHELEKSKRALENLVQEQKVQLEELEDELQGIEDAKLRLEVNTQAMKANFERELVSRDEASEEKRRQILKQLRELEQEIEDERKQRSSAVAAKKKIEGDYQELEMMLEGASNAKEDLLKQNKKLQNALKDYQHDLDDARQRADEANENAKASERRAKDFEAQCVGLQEDLAASERGRRQAQQERDELLEEMSSAAVGKNAIAEENKKLLHRIAQLDDDLEEEQNEALRHLEKSKKLQQMLDDMKEELNLEKTNSGRLEADKLSFERQVRELQGKLEEIETQVKAKQTAALAALQNKNASLEEQLENESKEKQALSKSTRRAERKMKELALQVEDERRQSDQYKDQMEKANSRMKALKRQIDQNYDEMSAVNAAKRKLQRDLDEQIEVNDSLQRENNTLKQRQRRGYGDRTSSVRKTTRNPSPEEESDDDI
ncbi:hypothetical protein ACHWQZ_G013281 [Mnemiopsis leidyi]